MGLFNGILGSVINPVNLASLALGPAGWATLATRIATQAFATQALQMIGQQLNLPQSAINLAVGAFNQGAGFSAGVGGGLFPSLAANGSININQLANLFMSQGMAPVAAVNAAKQIAQQADVSQNAQTKDTVQSFVNQQNLNGNIKEANKEASNEISSVMNGKGSILMKLAIALGKMADNKMANMAATAEQLGKFGEVTGKNTGEYGELTAQMTAFGQEFSMITNALNSVIKSLGEGASTIARKG